jgi:(R,R)-butanediol dehydrogenase/meso-butanediol dehydrogenase/diacetyl reductase
MKAIVFHGPRDIRLEGSWPDTPPPAPGEVTVDVSWCGVCGTDIEEWQSGVGIIPVDEPHPLTGRKAPLVLGHEFSGRVARLGGGVRGLQEGQSVAAEVVIACRECYYCQRHDFPLCPRTGAIGQSTDGAFCRYVNVPAYNLFPLPEGAREDVAALAEPVSVAVHAVRRGNVRPGHRVAVIGAGPIGLACQAVALVAGASDVFTVEANPRRLQAARSLGATAVFDANDPHWQEAFDDITEGRGADVVLETGASPASVTTGLQLTGRGGRLVMISVPREPFALDSLDFFIKGKEIVASVSHVYDEDFRTAVGYLMHGRIDGSRFITRYLHLDDGIEKGFEALLDLKDDIKILVTPHDDWELPRISTQEVGQASPMEQQA